MNSVLRKEISAEISASRRGYALHGRSQPHHVRAYSAALADRRKLRRKLPSNTFIQFLARPTAIQGGRRRTIANIRPIDEPAKNFVVVTKDGNIRKNSPG